MVKDGMIKTAQKIWNRNVLYI